MAKKKPPRPADLKARSSAPNLGDLEHGTWQLIRGDCLDRFDGLPAVATGSVAHLITDPPFSEHVHRSVRTGRRGARKGVLDVGYDALTEAQRVLYAHQFARVSAGWTIVFCDMESQYGWQRDLETMGLEHIRFGFWRVHSTPQRTGDRPASAGQAIEIAHTPGKKIWNGGGKDAYYEVPLERDRDVTGQKPLSLIRQAVLDFTRRGDLVCDPFAGSGTTGVACLMTGRRFLGWESNPDTHKAACVRMDAVKAQPELFEPPTTAAQERLEAVQ